MRVIRFAMAAALAVACVVPSVARATCGAESCPLVRSGMGADAGRFSFDLRFQEVTQDRFWNAGGESSLEETIADAEQHGEVELFTRTRSWVAEVRASLTDRLSAVATLPYLDREHRHWLRHTPVFNPMFVDVWKYQGLGDATVLGHFAAVRGEGASLTLQAGVKLPTGRRHLPDEARDNFGFESALEPAARPGTGSTDWLVGAIGSRALPWRRTLPLTASVLARLNTKGTDDYRVGNELQAGLASGWAAHERLTLLGQVNFAGHGKDVSAEASEASHSGMRALFVTPGLSVGVSHGLVVYGLYQARVWGHTDEATVVARDHVMVGTAYAFGH
jgi:hypothetical protein